MDELKKYFQQHRKQLDTDIPGEDTWQNIRRKLHPVAPVKTFSLFKWAVVACFIILGGIATYLLVKKDNEKKLPVITRTDTLHHQPLPQFTQPKLPVEKNSITQPQQPAIARQSVHPVKATKHVARKSLAKKFPAPVYGFENIEASYTSMVNLQLERLRTEPIYAEDASYFNAFKKQFADLANDEELVKKQIRQTGMADEYFEELINIYQEKINVLKRLRFEINRMNNRVKQTGPGIQQLQPSYINL